MSRSDAPALVHPTAHMGGAGLSRLMAMAVFAVTMTVALAILLHFHDRFWWAPGEGAYAHVAERLLQGEVLNGTVQGIHTGYVNFANALALKLFGLDLLSLRYPLVVLTLIQSAIVFWLLAGRGLLVACAGALVMSGLTFVQFLNPTAHWYALFLCVLIIALLSSGRQEQKAALELLGFLVVTIILFQQVSGILVAMGVFTCLLLQEQRAEARERVVLARVLAALMFTGLGFYLIAKTDLVSALLLGSCPLLLIALAGVRTRFGDRRFCIHLLRMGVGGLIAFLPLLAYHLLNSSLGSWWADTVGAGFLQSELPSIDVPHYVHIVWLGLQQLLEGRSVGEALNGVFWIVLPLLPLVLALFILTACRRGQASGRAALPVVAAFYALVSVHYQVPTYLLFSTALTLAALLFLGSGAGRACRQAVTAGCLVLTLIGLSYQAGKPLNRHWAGIVQGRTDVSMLPAGLARANLDLDVEEAALYRYLVNTIRTQTEADDHILALPMNPELYFLSERRNPLRFFNAALGIGTEAELRQVAAILEERPPRLVVYRPSGRDNTSWVRRLMADMRGDYVLVEERGGFQIYRRSDRIDSGRAVTDRHGFAP